jgi:nucleoside permease NupC
MMCQTKKNICAKKLLEKITKKKLWTFEWPKMSHIFISSYHNYFWVIFNFYFLNMSIFIFIFGNGLF